MHEAILYALSVGAGKDPLDRGELRLVVESDQFVVLPTLAVVVANCGLTRKLPVDYSKVVHGEQFLTIHRSLPTSAEVIADARVVRAADKGAKGALIYHETAVRLAATNEPLFTATGAILARGDGGFGGSDLALVPHALPNQMPDHVHVTETRPDQALLYRLNGDLNPLHADPEVALRAGFPRPILHGLCTYGIACRAVIAAASAHDPTRVRRFDARFTAPVFPGDAIETDIWIADAEVSFRCRVPARGVTVLDNGYCLLAR